MLEIEIFDDSPQQSWARQNLQLSVEVSRVVDGIDNVRSRFRSSQRRTRIFKVYLNAHGRFINVWLSPHVEADERCDQERDA